MNARRAIEIGKNDGAEDGSEACDQWATEHTYGNYDGTVSTPDEDEIQEACLHLANDRSADWDEAAINAGWTPAEGFARAGHPARRVSQPVAAAYWRGYDLGARQACREAAAAL